MRQNIHSTCDKDRGYSVPGILCSHPQGLPSANFKLLIFARKLIHRKIKIAVHMSTISFVPPELKWKSLDNLLNSMGHTAVHTDSGTRSRYTKCRLSWKRLGGSVNCFAIMVLSSNCYWSRMICMCLTKLVLRYQFEYNYISEKALLHPGGGGWGKGTRDFKWQGWSKDFLGFEISNSGIFLGTKIWQVFFFGSLIWVGIFWEH